MTSTIDRIKGLAKKGLSDELPGRIVDQIATDLYWPIELKVDTSSVQFYNFTELLPIREQEEMKLLINLANAQKELDDAKSKLKIHDDESKRIRDEDDRRERENDLVMRQFTCVPPNQDLDTFDSDDPQFTPIVQPKRKVPCKDQEKKKKTKH